jgi:hypothetical protein
MIITKMKVVFKKRGILCEDDKLVENRSEDKMQLNAWKEPDM